MADYKGIAVISVNLGALDKPVEHVSQSVSHDTYTFTDENFPPREKAMTPRLQAKIPKCFAWQLVPDYEYYLWIDGNLKLAHPDSLKYILQNMEGYDIVTLKHPARPNIRQEVRYTRKGINQQSIYVLSRYTGELLAEMYDIVEKDKDYVDDLLVIGGVFLYRNTPAVQAMLKEWWYYQTRYILQDQISFPYVLKKSGIKINVLPDVYDKTPYLTHVKHTNNHK
jgi:hypothetical protein